jgi:hypothetical protein
LKEVDWSLFKRSGVGKRVRCLSDVFTEVGGVDADLTTVKGAGLNVRGSVDGVSSRFKLIDLNGWDLASAAALS